MKEKKTRNNKKEYKNHRSAPGFKQQARFEDDTAENQAKDPYVNGESDPRYLFLYTDVE